jgi:2-polyprenyl-3-methyl-5-hydroxy-6-metoxy-1,4-benzoquinol methylase
MKMNKDSSTECWNQVNIDEWIDKAQTNDFRRFYIAPYTLEKLGDVKDKYILDLGCGEGGYSRTLSRQGAIVTAVDCSETFTTYSANKAREENLEIKTLCRNANELTGIIDNTYDVVLCSMMLMDVEDLDGTLKEIYRVIKQNGRVFISILHPCFKPKESKWILEDDKIKVVVSDYFNPTEWVGEIKGICSSVIYRHRTLSEYIKAFVGNKFKLVDLNEPIPSEEQMDMSSRIKWLSKIPMYLFMELEK